MTEELEVCFRKGTFQAEYLVSDRAVKLFLIL